MAAVFFYACAVEEIAATRRLFPGQGQERFVAVLYNIRNEWCRWPLCLANPVLPSGGGRHPLFKELSASRHVGC